MLQLIIRSTKVFQMDQEELLLFGVMVEMVQVTYMRSALMQTECCNGLSMESLFVMQQENKFPQP